MCFSTPLVASGSSGAIPLRSNFLIHPRGGTIMRKVPRSSSVGRLFSRKSLGGGGRPQQRRRRSDRRPDRQLERLEERRLLAFDLIAAYAQAERPFFLAGSPAETLATAPQEITLRFTPGTAIKASTLGSISVVRSGTANDVFGNGNDVAVVPGSIVVESVPNENEVVIRFAESLPDDSYRITVGAGLSAEGSVGSVNATAFDFRLDRGAFVQSVVPQPTASISRDGVYQLIHARGQIQVWFNTEDPLAQASAENPAFYRLQQINPTTNEPIGEVNFPTAVEYRADLGRATLWFREPLKQEGLFRLDIGGADALEPVVFTPGSDDNSSFTTALRLGELTSRGAVIDAAIVSRSMVATPAGELGLPSQPGTVDEPGHRDLPVDSGGHGLPFATVDPASGITVIPYNFRHVIGTDPQGNTLFNVIAETQKQRAREIFELFSLEAGVRFVETADQGLLVATGDLRAFDPTVPVKSVAGLGGPGMGALMNSNINWGNSEYGGSWFRVAMHEIGHAIGLRHSYDLNSIMGAALGGEPIFPGDYDLVHLRQLFPQNGSDVDVYTFDVTEKGRFSAETIIARPGQPITSYLDSVISLYREEMVGGRTVRTLISRNDDYYGRDSFVELDLDPGTYFVAVTSTGNTAFDPAVSDSGANGRSEGEYRLSLGFTPLSAETNTIVDRTGKALDGDRDGEAGGVFSFWFQTADKPNTIYVDKGSTVAGPGDGTKDNAFKTIAAALAAVQPSTKVIRILGKQATPYEIGVDPFGKPLADGATFNVPSGVTAIIDRATAFKLRNAVIDIGSSSNLVSRAGASLQVLGVPNRPVVFTSWHDDSVGGDTDGPGMGNVDGGQWGGIVFRADSDAASKAAFVNTIANAQIRYGGGEVQVDSKVQRYAPIQLEDSRPTVVFNSITNSAGAAIAATPNSFLDDGERIGPEFRGNSLMGNSLNGLFLNIETKYGEPIQRLDVPARLRSADLVYVVTENLLITGAAGGYLEQIDGGTGAVQVVARASGRLVIDPGVVMKLQTSRIELERGESQLVAEGSPFQQVVFTSLGDNRYGAGGTFDTNGNVPDKFDFYGGAVAQVTVGDWGGIVLNAGSHASLANVYLAFGGGVTPIEGGFDAFNAIEVHQADLRLANSRVEMNASGAAWGTRTGRGGNTGAAVFVRGAQPIITNNDFRSNQGAVITIDANSLTDEFRPDTGRVTGGIDLVPGTAGNYGPLVRGNLITAVTSTGAAPAPTGSFDIQLIVDSSLPLHVKTAVEAAAARWESVIIGDLSSQRDPVSGVRIDDVLVYVRPGLLGGNATDGASGILANAGPTQVRPRSDVDAYLPFIAEIGLDLADLGSSLLTDTLIHELAHALGFTSVPEALGLIQGTQYVGLNGLREYQLLAPGARNVPLQTEASGDAGAHWAETVFGNELMTPLANGRGNPLSRITVGAFQDMGYSVNYAAADPYTLPGTGAPKASPPTAGMVIRGGELTVESVWDDTDIVHVLQEEILVGNFHTTTGLRLLSESDASLIVKLSGAAAGLTASGSGLDIDDRIGGTVQVIGQPGFPVVLTSLADDTVGAGIDPLGRTVTDTNADGGLTQARPADWRSLRFLPFSNDRNVAVVIESEATYTARLSSNGVPADAEWLGVLAPNYPAGTNSWESAADKSGDANRRLGFEVHGSIAFDDSSDVDVYSFTGYAGSEVWIDIDKTSSSLDTMVELLDSSGRVLARSVDAIAEGLVVPSDIIFDYVGGQTVAYQLANAGVLPGTLTGTLYDFNGVLPLPIQTFTVNAAGVVSFRTVHNAPEPPAVSGWFDTATGILTVDFAEAAGPTVIDVRYSFATNALTAITGQASVVGQDAWLGGDSYTTNPKDAGLRVILPGTKGNQANYFLRVRSQPRYEPVATFSANGGVAATTKAQYEADLLDPAKVGAGATSGRYELRVRLQQRDEKPGSTVRFADIRYATVGIDAEGLPARSLLVGEAGEAGDAANDLSGAQYLGNLLQSDLNALSVAGSISSEADVDWYTFAVNYEQIQSIAGANAGPYFAATMFDIDYADGFRGDLTISVFDSQGTLIYVGRDSNVADDQAAPGQGSDLDDLSRGSIGELDPYIGSVELVAGRPTGSGGGESGGVITPPDPARQLRYYVAISSNERLPSALDATFFAGATNSLIRLEPVNSVRRVVEDHIGSVGYTDFGGTEQLPTTGAIIDLAQLNLHVTPFTLGDVTLYVSSPGGVTMRDPVSGQAEGVVNDTAFANTPLADLDMRPDGRLFAYAGVNNANGTAGRLLEINTTTGQVIVIGDDQIPNVDGDNPLNFQTTTNTVRALAFRATDWGKFEELWFVVADGPESKLYRAADGGTTAGTPDAAANQAWQANSLNLFGYRGRITVDGEYPTVTGVQFADDVGGQLFGVTDDGRLITIQPGNKVPDDGAPEDGGRLVDFDAEATLVVDFSEDLATVGATGFTALAAAPQNLHGGALQGKFFALTNNGRLALLDPEATTLEWVIDSGEVGQLERTGDTGGSLYYRGDTTAVVDLAGSPLVAVVQPGAAVNPTVTGTAQAIGTDTRAVVVRQVAISAGPIQRATTGAVDVQEEFQVIPLGNTGGITAGMLIVGEDVPYGTTVVDINDDGVVVDLAFDVSGVADGTGLAFYAPVGQGASEVLNVNNDDTAEVAIPTDGLTSSLAAGMRVAGGGLTEPTTIVAIQLVPAPAADQIVVVLSRTPGDPATPLQFFGATEITGIDPADDGRVVGVSTLTYAPAQANYDVRIPKGTAVDGNTLNQPVGEFRNQLVDIYSGVGPALQGVKDGGLYVERNAAGAIVSGSYVLMADVPVVSVGYFIPGTAPGAAGPAVRGEYYTVVAGQGAVKVTEGLNLDSIVLADTAGLVPGLLFVGGGIGLDQEATILAVDPDTNTVQLSAIPPDLNRPFWFFGVNQLSFASGLVPEPGADVEGTDVPAGITVEYDFPARVDRTLGHGGLVSVAGGVFVPGQTADVTLADVAITTADLASLEPGMRIVGESVPAGIWISEVDDRYVWVAPAGLLDTTFLSEELTYIRPTWSTVLAADVIGGLIQVSVEDAKGINVGMLVSGPGFQAGTLVTGVNPVTNIVTLSKRTVDADAGRPVFFYLTAAEYLSAVVVEVAGVPELAIAMTAGSALQPGMRLRGQSLPDGVWIERIADGYAWLSGPMPLGAFPTELVTVIEPTVSPVLATAGAAGNRILTLDEVAAIEVGMPISGLGIATGTIVTAITGSAVTLSKPLTQSADAGQSIFFYRSSGWVPSASDPVPLASTVPQPHARGDVVVGVLDAGALTVGMNAFGDSVLPGTTLLAFDADSSYVWLSNDLATPPAAVDLRFSFLDDAAAGGTVVRVSSPYGMTDGGVATGMVVFGPGILPGTTIVGFQDFYDPTLIGGGVAEVDAVLGVGQEVSAQTASGDVTGTAAPLTVPGSGYRRVTIVAVPIQASVAGPATGIRIPLTSIAGIKPGMLARGPGVPYGTVVTGINPAAVQGGSPTVSLSNAVTSLIAGTSLSFYTFVGQETATESVLTVNPDGTARIELLLNDGVTDGLVSGLAAGMWVTGAGLATDTQIVSIRLSEAVADRLVITLSQRPTSFIADPSDFTQPLSFWGVSNVTGLQSLTTKDDGKLVGTSTLSFSPTGDYDLRIPLGTTIVVAGGTVSLSQPVGEFTSRLIDVHGGVTPTATAGIEPGMLFSIPGAVYGSVAIRVAGSPVFTAPVIFDAAAAAAGGVGEYFAVVPGQSNVVAAAGTTAAEIVLAPGVAGLQPGMRVVGGGFTADATILSVDPATNTVTLSADVVDLGQPFSFFGADRVEFAAGAIPAIGDTISGDGIVAGTSVIGVSATGLTLSQAPTATNSGIDIRLVRPSAKVAATLTRNSANVEVPSGSAVTVGMVALGLGIPNGTFVTAVAGQTVTLSQPAEYTAVRELAFVAIDVTKTMAPVTTAVDVLSGDVSGLHAGMLVFGQGVKANTVIASVSGNRVRLSQPITVGNGQYAFIRDGRVVTLAPATATNHLAVGQEVTANGVPAGTTVAAVGAAANGTITLSQSVVAARTGKTLDFITRDVAGMVVPNQRVVGGLADTSTLRPGLVVFGPGIAGNTTIASVDDAHGITLSQEADLRGTVELAFLPRQDVTNPTVVRDGNTTAAGTRIHIRATDLRVGMFVISDDLPGWYGRIASKTADSITLTTAVEPGVTASFRFFNVSTVSYLADWTGDRNFSEFVGGGTGIAFSTLDVNLWHPTVRRGDVTNDSVGEADPGHGINPTADLSRQEARDQGRGTTNGGTSMYFGLEQWVPSNAAYGGFGSSGQYGADAAWQRYLTEGTDRGNTYDLPGGAYGSLTTNPFSLEGYSYTDKPTVYFNYWLQTENAEGLPSNNNMRDSARVFISKDDGLTWELIATNNSVRNTSDSELATYASVSTRIDGEPGIQDPRQQVQDLFETSSWRQARIDLGEYAGEASLRFRFDFSTAGEMNPQAVDPAGTILGSAASSGNFQNGPKDGSWRGTANNYEGFYIDDIIVGFAERGEMVTGGVASQTTFFDINTPDPVTAPSQSLSGPYQLEIRRGTEYSTQVRSGSTIYQLFDTNDRLIPSQGNSSGFGANIGDQNQARQQGQFIVENNLISYSAEYGISIDAGIRDGGSNAALPGTVRNLPTLNNARLVPGAVVRNNVINEFGAAGILFSGDANTGTVPIAAVPFGRIVNNTIYGGKTAQGTGILVTENAGPTLLNNLFANLATGVSIDASSRAGTVLGMGAYSGTATQVAGGTETGGIQIESAPFVNPAARNFYLIAGSRAIDSELNSLQDRAEFTAVNAAIGVPPSPILAPDYDVYGQLRGDDPGTTNLSGLGNETYKDRGAVDRVDFVNPLIALLRPDDGTPVTSGAGPVLLGLSPVAASSLTAFALRLSDVGTGIDPTTVGSHSFLLSKDGVLLTEGVDYLFRYLPATSTVTLQAAAVFTTGRYELRVFSAPRTADAEGRLTDLANNPLRPNLADGSIGFVISVLGVPGAPTRLTGLTGESAVSLSWTPGPSQGAATIAYQIAYQSPAGEWTNWPQAIPGSSASVTGLTNGFAYDFRVRAINAVGLGDWSESVSVVPAILPPFEAAAPLATAADRAATVGWAVPLAGSSPILGYELQVSTDGTTWQPGGQVAAAQTTATVANLTNGVSHRFRVAAFNKNGLGPWSGASLPVVPAGPAFPPIALAAVGGDRSARLTWSVPSANGGAISAYLIEITGPEGVRTESAGTAAEATVSGLTNGITYSFRVAAVTGAGVGGFAEASQPVTPLAAPTVPLAVATTPGNKSASISWQHPSETGGRPVTEYIVEVASGSGAIAHVVPGSSLSFEATGLTNGATYTVRVAARNAVGTGPFAAAAGSVVPREVADAPTRLIATAGSGTVSLVWTAPWTSVVTGSIVDYVIQVSTDYNGNAAAAIWRTIADGTSTLTRATFAAANGVPQVYRVAAVTTNGVGAFSLPSLVVTPYNPSLVPAAPTITLAASPQVGRAKLTWTEPAMNGGSPATGYVVRYRLAGTTTWASVPRSTTVVVFQGLTSGRDYEFQVLAKNAAGLGVPSEVITIRIM
jgi:hypothetical protein